MIEIFEITKQYGEQLLFKNVSFNVRSGERIGLVGRNGYGKSTLLKIIIGEEGTDSGRIAVPNDYKIGYLHQTINFTEKTVLKEACKGLVEASETEDWKVKKILMGLSFTEEDLEKDPGVFSGGYQMRIELAKVLVSEPDILLLDEPTNFLDIVSIRWLETFLKSWRGELIVISHDRNFMDSVCTHIVGIHRANVRKITGKTDNYYSFIAQEEEVYEKRRINTEKKRKQIEGYISSFRAKARRAKSVQSSIKRLDKMEQFDKLDSAKTLSFSFNPAEFRPPVVMDVKGVSFSYSGGMPYMINDLAFTVERGDKICIAGANGKGKTTLAKILAGALEPLEGEVKRNPQVMMAYYEQGNTAKLDDNMTIEDEVLVSHPGKNKTAVRGICGAMMFSGDAVLKKISVISGGERSRVLLAKTLLSPSNLLILDEPTHHLDMESCSAMFEAVQEYSGAAIVVTHDEYFLHKVATKLIMFVGDQIIVFPGNYSEFLEQVGWGDVVKEKAQAPKRSKEKIEVQTGMSKKEERKLRAEQRALYSKKVGPLENKIAQIEKDIVCSEKEYKALTEDVIKSSEKQDAAAIVKLTRQLKDLKPRIDKLYAELNDVTQEYERVKKEIE